MTSVIDQLTAALSDRYRIERELGAGGMATVYLAHDVKHDRKVALKVLRPELAAILGAERFLQEIKTTANLQHPHILPLYDSGRASEGPSGGASDFVFYVMPFVEGESLRDRLDRERQLPVDEAVRIAREVADALDYAHRHGVIHRDIKPENVLLHDGRALVADFGIALAVSRSDGGTRMTETGMSLGTPHYMSPEQAMGEREITAKSDVYALGCVVYEMLVGEPPFAGPTAQAIIARVLTEDPRSLTLQRRTIPPHVEAAVTTALAKLPADRFGAAAEFSAALANPAYAAATRPAGAAATAGARPAGPSARQPTVLALAAIALLAIIAAAWGWLGRPAAPGERVMRNWIRLSDSVQLRPAIEAVMLAIAPDGSRLAFVSDEGNGSLWIRRLDDLNAQPLLGTEGARSPTFSPDGQWLAFVRGTSLEKVRVDGGATIRLADSASGNYFGSVAWLDDNSIVFTDVSFAMRRVSAAGGVVSDVRTGSGRAEEPTDGLPDARGLLYQTCTTNCTDSDIRVLDFRSGESRQLVAGAVRAWYLPTGSVLFVREDGAALVAPFDLETLAFTDSPVPVLSDLAIRTFFPQVAIADDGTLIYVAGRATAPLDDQIVQVDRAGRATPVDPEWVGSFSSFALSRDGRTLAVAVSEGSSQDIWLKQIGGGPFTRLTFSGANRRPAWSPDGRTVAFVRDTLTGGDVYAKRVDGSGPARVLASVGRMVQAVEWSADGMWLLARTDNTDEGRGDIVGVRFTGDTTPVSVVASPYEELHPALSPDGQWLALTSSESGRQEVYVRPFPATGDGRWQVSLGGGALPQWAPDGRELYYVTPERQLMAAAVTTRPQFAVGSRTRLFTLSATTALDPFGTSYQVMPDGQSFLFIAASSSSSELALATRIVLVSNWFTELRERMRQ